MKKNIVRIILFMFVFMLFANNAKATETIYSYGTYFDDTLGYWDQQKVQESTFPSNYTWFGNAFSFKITDSVGPMPAILLSGGSSKTFTGSQNARDVYNHLVLPNMLRTEGSIDYTSSSDLAGSGARLTIDLRDGDSWFPEDKNVKLNQDYSEVQNYYNKYGKMPDYIYYCIKPGQIDEHYQSYSLDYVVDLFTIASVGSAEIDIKYYVDDFGYKDIALGQSAYLCFYGALSPETDINACQGLEALLDNLSEVAQNKECTSKDFIDFYQDVRSQCDTYITNNYTDGCTDLCNKLATRRDEMCEMEPMKVTCKSLGPQMVGWLVKILKILRYIVPVLAIILSVMDFISAIASSDDDALKKAGQRFAKRIIAVVIFLLLPVILQLLFDVFKINGLESGNPYCIK